MKVTVTCPDTKQPITYMVEGFVAKDFFKLFNKMPQIFKALGNTIDSPQSGDMASLLVTVITSNMITVLMSEGLYIVADKIGKDVEYVEKLDMADLIELITAIVEETDFEKLGKAIKKLMEVGALKIQKPKQIEQ